MDPRILETLTPLIEAFELLGVEYQVGGSVASSVHGVPRSSLDIDLLVSLELAQVDALVSRIETDFYVPRARVVDAVERGSSFNVIHLETMTKVDVFIARSDPFLLESLGRKKRETLGEEPEEAVVFVTTAEDIVLHKLSWYRKGGEASERQWTDVIGVLKVQEATLDLAHMTKWARELGVDDLLERVLKDAGMTR